jgi:RND family efflux transporter MFP subunit
MSTAEERVMPKPHLANVRPDDGEQLSQRVRSLRLPQETVGGRSAGRWIMRLVCLTLAGSTAVLGYQEYTRQASSPPSRTASAKPDSPASSPAEAVPSMSATVAASGGIALESKGYIIPAHQILVSPKVGGMVVKLRIIESQRVVKDEVLAELEDTEFRADRDRARAQWECSKATLLQAEAKLKQADHDWRRAESLRPDRAISDSDYDMCRANYDMAMATVAVSNAQVDQAAADLAKAEWQLNNCIIRAPTSGTILKKNAEEGSLVNPIAMQGFYSLCEMADLSDLEVDLTIQERDISKISQGQSCKVRAEAFPDRVYEGKVSRLMPTADRSKGAIPVRVKVTVPANEEGVYLKPEMGALVSFLNK